MVENSQDDGQPVRAHGQEPLQQDHHPEEQKVILRSHRLFGVTCFDQHRTLAGEKTQAEEYKKP